LLISWYIFFGRLAWFKINILPAVMGRFFAINQPPFCSFCVAAMIFSGGRFVP
jgi:hypothetical protein